MFIVRMYINDKDFQELLIQQLIEMQSGLCPQGRTTRLIQILIPMIEK